MPKLPAATRKREAVAPASKIPASANVGGVLITHPDRVIDSSTGLTKMDLVHYYHEVAKRILPHLAGRPVSLLRAPAGIGRQLFFQKHDNTLKIPGLRELDPGLDPSHPPLLAIGTLQGLVGAAQMNVVEFHTWNSTTRNIDKPDRIVFDLDPGEGLAWPLMLEAAQLVHTFLDELGLASFLKTSGGKGLHVVVPLTPRDDWDAVKLFSRQVVHHIAATVPSRFVARSGPLNRLGKVYIDYLRNSRGATTVAAFSARARPGIGVSMPCSWEDLPALTGGAHWTLANALERVSGDDNPWATYATTRQTLGAARKKLDPDRRELPRRLARS
jgi:bifunctional non-homologous end joining protein LigD